MSVLQISHKCWSLPLSSVWASSAATPIQQKKPWHLWYNNDHPYNETTTDVLYLHNNNGCGSTETTAEPLCLRNKNSRGYNATLLATAPMQQQSPQLQCITVATLCQSVTWQSTKNVENNNMMRKRSPRIIEGVIGYGSYMHHTRRRQQQIVHGSYTVSSATDNMQQPTTKKGKW